MERPLKRRRVGLDNADEQLHYRRALNDSRLKASFESIFEKYGKDFSGVGDEIDLESGEIVVNNGHLLSMRDEQDIDGGGNEVDELYGLDDSPRQEKADIYNVEEDGILPEFIGPSLVHDQDEGEITDEDVDSLMGDIGYLDNKLVVANPCGFTDIGILGLPHRNAPPSSTRTKQHPELGGSHNNIQHQAARQHSVYLDPGDLDTDPKWIAPPLPDLPTNTKYKPLQDKIQILTDNTHRSPSPMGESLWATPEMPALQKHSRRKWLKTDDALLRHLKLSTNLTYREMQHRFPGRASNALQKRWSFINSIKEPSVRRTKNKDNLVYPTRSSTIPSVSEITKEPPDRTSSEVRYSRFDILGCPIEKENSNNDRVCSKTSEEEHLIQSKTLQQLPTLDSHRATNAEFSQAIAEASIVPPTSLKPPKEILFRSNQTPPAEVQQLPPAEVQQLPAESQTPPAEIQYSTVKVRLPASIDGPLQTPPKLPQTVEPLTKKPVSHPERQSRMFSVVVERLSHNPIVTEPISLAKSNLQPSVIPSPPQSVEDTASPKPPCSQDVIGRDSSHTGPIITSDEPCILPPLLGSTLPTMSCTIGRRRESCVSAQTQPDTLPGESTPCSRESTPLPRELTPLPEESTPLSREATSLPREATPLPREPTPLPREPTPLPREPTPLPRESTALSLSPDLPAKALGKESTLTNPETTPISQDGCQEFLQANASLRSTSHCSTPTPARLPLQANTPPSKLVGKPRSEEAPGLLDPCRDDLDFISTLLTPARHPKKIWGSSAPSKSTSGKRKRRTSSIAVTSFGSILGDLSDDELSLKVVTCSKIPSAEKATIRSPNRQCGSAGYRCDRKVCLRCT